MVEYFDNDGHLTQQGLQKLIEGEENELTRLEVAEHLSFCDCCIERYALMLEEATLIEPVQSVSESVMSKIKRKAARIFLNRYGTMTVAACFTMTLWFSGVFNIDVQHFQRMGIPSTRVEEKFTFTERVMEKLDYGLDKLKGVLDYGEK